MKRTLRLITWLMVLVVVSCGCVAACPEGCSCYHDQGLYSASCSVLPYNSGKIETLTLQPSQPRTSPLELVDGQFNQARHLKYLNLRNNSIYFIHKKAFYGAKNLIEIDLSNNFIEELDPLLFQHLTSLTALILRGNSIQLLPGEPFVISNSIQHLDIGQCGIKSVPRGIFYGLTKLKYLSLDRNFLKTLKYNSLPKGLKYLNISQNLIVNVPSEVISSLSNLRRINLGGNPINCSCSLLNLQDWLSGRGVIFEDTVICALPHEYHGTSWSKVDENKLCLAETRREEISHSASHIKQIKSTKGKHFQNENSYLNENSYFIENLQSDQPHLLNPNTQAEILFQNDDTVGMGVMMRDQEDSESVINPMDLNINTDSVNNESSSEIMQPNLTDHNDEERPDVENKEPSKNVSAKINEEENNLETNNELNTYLHNSTTSSQSSLNDNSPIEYKEDKKEQQNILKEEGFFEVSKYTTQTNARSEESTDYPELEDTTEEEEVSSTSETLISDVEKISSSNISDPSPHNKTGEETVSTPETLVSEAEGYDTTPGTSEVNIKYQAQNERNETSDDDKVTITTENVHVQQNISQLNIPLSVSGTELFAKSSDAPSNKSSVDSSKYTKSVTEHKIKEVAGAEVLMFCVGTIVICLVLYSVHKCRSSSVRKTMRTNKDMEANHGTEMQDMATLLPKPEEDNRKHNLKYPDENESSENIKLLTINNENETTNHKTDDTTGNKVENKHSLNNNLSSSPTSKIPLVKPSNEIKINPSTPIQRTKAKVTVIPDSIPKTPIFVQKTYNGIKKP